MSQSHRLGADTMAIFKLFSQEVNSFVSSLQFVPRALKSALSEDSDYFSSGEESERSSSPESHCEVRAEGKMFPQSLKSLFSKIENKANAQEGRTGVQPLGTNPWGPTPGVQPHAQKGRVGDQPHAQEGQAWVTTHAAATAATTTAKKKKEKRRHEDYPHSRCPLGIALSEDSLPSLPPNRSKQEILVQKYQEFMCPEPIWEPNMGPGVHLDAQGMSVSRHPEDGSFPSSQGIESEVVPAVVVNETLPVHKHRNGDDPPRGQGFQRTPVTRQGLNQGGARSQSSGRTGFENFEMRGGGHRRNGSPPGGGGGGPANRLVIKIDPSDYNVVDPAEQTVEGCRAPFIHNLKSLFEVVQGKDDFSWMEDKEVQQYLAMTVARIGCKGQIPGAAKKHEIDDFFECNDQGYVESSSIGFSMSSVLTGVSSTNPSQYFTPCDTLDEGPEPSEAVLRPAVVKLYHLIQDLSIKRIEVEVQYSFGIDPASGDPFRVIYDDTFIKGPLYQAVKKVSRNLNTMFNFQNKALEVSQALEALNEEAMEEFEAELCDFVLAPELTNLPNFKGNVQSLHQSVNQLKKGFRDYEYLGNEIYVDHCLTAAYATAQFKNQSHLVRFLKNDSSDSTPWLRFPRQWTSQKSQVTFKGEQLNIMASPSRLFVHRSTAHVDSITSKVGDMIKRALNAITQSNQAEDPLRVPPPVFAERVHADRPAPSYPHCLVTDASKLLIRLQKYDKLECAGTKQLEDFERTCIEMLKEFQQVQWKGGVVLHTKDQDLQVQLQTAKTYLGELLTKRKEEDKLKEVEQREISKSIAATKAPILDKDARNIMQFLDYHDTYKSANPLARCMKIREGLPDALKERVINETNPDSILSLLRRLYMAEDVILPLARAEIQALPNAPAVNSAQEGKAYACILSFVTKLQKSDLYERLDFSTITLAASKLSRVRQDTWDKDWLMRSQTMTGTSLRTQEDAKRDLFVEFLKLHDNLLQRRLLQTTLQQKEKTEQTKHTKTFATRGDLRETRYDKKRNKPADRNFKGPKQSSFDCILCKKEGGHSSRGKKSLLGCPKLQEVNQAEKLSFIKKQNACTRCLRWGHTLENCFTKTSADFLQHDDCHEGMHHPEICPNRSTTKRSTVSRATHVDADAGNVLNLLEEVEVKARYENPTVTVNCVYDNCSDSNWISSSLAECLPKHKVSDVSLQLSTIKSSGPIKTKKHTFLIKVRNRFQKIEAYETSSIGASSMNDDTIKAVKEHFKSFDPLHISSGKIDLLIGLQDYNLHPELEKAVQAQSLRLFTSSTTPMETFLVAGTIPASLMGGAGAQKSCFFSIADLYKSLLQDQALDLPPAQCQVCRVRSKKCYKCALISKPISLKDQYEFDLITKPMVFDKESKKVTTRYLPTTKESFKELFPPELNNRKEASAIAKRTLKNLKKNGQVEAYHAAFQKNIDDGSFTEISNEELKEWDDQGLPSNYVSLHPVKKLQSDPSKLAIRIVTNSSLNRLARVGGKTVTTSLNSVLPSPVRYIDMTYRLSIYRHF